MPDNANREKLKKILRNAFELALKEELFIAVLVRKDNKLFRADTYIPRIGYYRREYKRRGMIEPNDGRGFSILTIDHTLYETNPFGLREIGGDEEKFFPDGQQSDDKISEPERIDFAAEKVLSYIENYLPDTKSKNFQAFDVEKIPNGAAAYPCFRLFIDFGQ